MCDFQCDKGFIYDLTIATWYCTWSSNLTLRMSCKGDTKIVDYIILGTSWNHVYRRYIVVCISWPRFCKTHEFGSCTLMPWWYLQTKRCPASYFQLRRIRLRALLDLATRSWAPFNEESDWIPFVSGSCVQALWNRGFSLSPLHCMVHTIHARFYVDISVTGSPSLLFLLTLWVGSKLRTRR